MEEHKWQISEWDQRKRSLRKLFGKMNPLVPVHFPRRQRKCCVEKTTSFTVLKRLCERGIFQNQNGTVTSLISKEEFFARHSEQYVEETFAGSLPAFIAAFGSRKKLSDSEIDEMIRLIEKMRG